MRRLPIRQLKHPWRARFGCIGLAVCEISGEPSPIQKLFWSGILFFDNTYNIISRRIIIIIYNSIFGIPIVLEENVSDSIVDCLLNEAMNGNSDSVTDEFSISHSDMMEFVAFVSKIEAKMEIEAENLLHKYFMVTRDKRPSNSIHNRMLNAAEIHTHHKYLSQIHWHRELWLCCVSWPRPMLNSAQEIASWSMGRLSFLLSEWRNIPIRFF